MIRKPEPRREGALVAALRGVATHGPAVLRAGPLLLRGAVLSCFALYLGFETLKAGMASVGLPIVSALALAAAGARMVARVLGAGSADGDPRPARAAVDERTAEPRRPAERPFGRRGS